MARAAVFIDGAYFDNVLLNFGRMKVDYEKFSDSLCQGYERLRTYYYHCLPYQSSPPTAQESQKYASMRMFLSTLERLSRFEVRLGKIAKYGQDPPRQKQVDALLAIDLVRLTAKQQISKAILVVGDGDHVPAVKSAKEEGAIVDLCFL